MRTETRTYEVYNLHELTREVQAKAHSRWMKDFDYAWEEENRATLQAFERTFKSRRKDGHTIVVPIGIVSLLITARKKIIWKGLDYWNTLSITIGTICIYPRLFGNTITRQSARVVYLSPMIVYWRGIVWSWRYWNPYTTSWKPPMIPLFTNL